ncbi:hypothetical protein TPHA_0F02340 [Tetrapisispora phaffii CBS 4417]|uniref:RRM domain-containing protein n=1 Tax=Tetrapisispora phaffii (strain ATCC 24235 / CBS 4417 / NBRC 1672 / NRRL Y-8282 / UCD 70-5) TaxID=1071381 RepID=G8BUC9_TETPH|nr:hypothetical protein TPHA_0F02340 [Tetrapisispora phaffii CBS 4417]CCE63715.1 hypothetical protein TPHA_0F02340 [Tetrapisispora phaffii CBS 4417]
MAEEETKKQLTKKQLKALESRKSKKDREKTKELKRSVADEPAPRTNADGEPAKKKRKTRRGHGGKGKSGSQSKNRFIIFVGSLPKDITATELQTHFKSSSPDFIRLRSDKGIAFLEFDTEKDLSNIQRRMDVALLQHRTTIRDKTINVELTVGGGGNSKDRLEKLQKKNEKLDVERQERVRKMIKDSAKKAESKNTSNNNNSSSNENAPKTTNGIHPDRLKLIK